MLRLRQDVEDELDRRVEGSGGDDVELISDIRELLTRAD